NAAVIGDARPDPIQGLNDRANDCWEPLLAIADAAGGHWPKSARHAAIVLHGLEGDTPSIGIELLQDVKTMFDDKRASKIFSSELLDTLIADDEAPWATWNRGKPISPRQLAGKLAEFEIKSKDVRMGNVVKKGYEKGFFEEAWTRYLPADPPSLSATTLQPTYNVASSVADGFFQPPQKTTSATLQPSNGAGCSVVADKTPPLGGDRGNKGSKDTVLHEERL
ncbi:DUF3631 domain-containing protein, partial [Pseudomonas helleri]|uniref:DUF3631 domain-containing protein n=1 Tax=Pseudomonas helleri TaxID=1608996 RepID=UPI003FD48983